MMMGTDRLMVTVKPYIFCPEDLWFKLSYVWVSPYRPVFTHVFGASRRKNVRKTVDSQTAWLVAATATTVDQ